MADAKKINSLLKAATSGDVATLRKCLAGGASIEATDVNKMTPVMLAAQAGQLDAFRTLVDSGANLHALALDQMDLLECAAEGGHVDIIRFLIDKGHPLEGHWQPRSQVAKRTGHISPLIMAAINAHVEAARTLLEAGADRNAKFDGETSLQLVEEEIKHPIDDETAAKKPRYQAIAALLKGSTTKVKPPDDSAEREVERFAENARRPAYLKLRQILDEKCGPHRRWKPQPDHGIPSASVVVYTLAGCKKQTALEELQGEARKANCHLVLSETWTPGDDAVLALFPTDNKLAVVAAVGTCGANDSVRTADVLHWLASVDGENPFALVFCGHDFVGGAFVRTPKDVKKLAEEMAKLCPNCLDEDSESAEALATLRKKRKSFLLRWD